MLFGFKLQAPASIKVFSVSTFPRFWPMGVIRWKWDIFICAWDEKGVVQSGGLKNNRRDKFWANLGFGAFSNAVRGRRVAAIVIRIAAITLASDSATTLAREFARLRWPPLPISWYNVGSDAQDASVSRSCRFITKYLLCLSPLPSKLTGPDMPEKLFFLISSKSTCPFTCISGAESNFFDHLCELFFPLDAGAPKERRRRRAEKRSCKRVFLESPFLLCPL